MAKVFFTNVYNSPKVSFSLSCATPSWWKKVEAFIGRWKVREEGFISLDEVEDLLHGRW
ncbi:MAG: hypothetical protein F6K47_04130 [Symploca sp. SIO2E6]|nr:hypothetical protein [Symploca sp. SIO2E6]